MPLVRVTLLANTTFELNAAALPDDVRRFMGCDVQIGHTAEGHVVTRGERARTYRVGTGRCVAVGVGMNAADVMPANNACVIGK